MAASDPLTSAFLRLGKRAENSPPAELVSTFVDVGDLFTLLSSRDHQILYGRRGTGKTHALQYLGQTVLNRGEVAVYIDLRRIGSTGSWNDPRLPVTERATRLLADMLTALHEQILTSVFEVDKTQVLDPDVLQLLDDLADQLTQVRVVGGPIERQSSVKEAYRSADKEQIHAGITPTGVAAGLRATSEDTAATQNETTTKESGTIAHTVHFGDVSRLLEQIGKKLPSSRLWVLLDEWSVVPLDIQPLLAEFIRRSMLAVPGLTVKIGAIEHRSRFSIRRSGGQYVGIEVGADMGADLDLDDFMVFNNDAERAKQFFRELLFKHVQVLLEADDQDGFGESDELVRAAFTQRNAFDEFVRAAEGVPRDAFYIVSLAAQKAGGALISVPIVRRASRAWYQRDKLSAVSVDLGAERLLHWIIDEVIGTRHARAFLLEQGEKGGHPLISTLYDARVLHVVKRGIAARDRPGVRFNVYGLDYGCYVDLISTAAAPEGLFEAEGEDGQIGFKEVPADDYRSIRGAVLDVGEFERAMTARI